MNNKYVRAAIIVAVCLHLVACGDNPKPDRAAKKQERIEQAKGILAKTPQPRTYNFDGNQLVVVGIPLADDHGFIDVQRCYVWRDAEYKTSTLSCPSAQENPMDLSGGATPDSIHP